MASGWFVVRCKVCGFDVFFSIDPCTVHNYLVQCSHCRNVHDMRDPLRVVDPSETGILTTSNQGSVPFLLSPLCRPHVEQGGVSAESQLRSIIDVVDRDFEVRRQEAEARGISFADDMATQQMRRFTRAMQPVMCLFSYVEEFAFRKVGMIRGSSISVVRPKLELPQCGDSSNRRGGALLFLSPTSAMMYPLSFAFCVCWFLVRFVFAEGSPMLTHQGSPQEGRGGSVLLPILIDGSVAASLVFLWICSFTDPGYLLPDGATAVVMQPEAVESGGGAQSSRCSVCRHIRPPRAHHCYLCGLCVEEHDHHCQVTGSCIGKRNIRSFIMFCLFATVAAVLGGAVTIDFLINDGMTHFGTTCLAVAASIIIVPMAIVLPIFSTILIGGIARNVTQRERKRPELQNPQNNKGFVANCSLFLFRKSQPSVAGHPDLDKFLQT